MNVRAFSVVVDKGRAGVHGAAAFEMAWQTLLQRLERLSTSEEVSVMVVHDAGENDEIRKLFRKARRYLTAGRAAGGGGFRFAADRFIDDPTPRNSDASYFVQVADLVAYAGWRTYQRPGGSVARVVPHTMWNELGAANHRVVNYLSPNGSVPGVVLRTR
ncbi:DUF3800 domain-containing protein [Cellulomonas sp.]|uniref:DUF3800 domain-containing protein n=1 Tax=Cellulomonas sp. TaxID=40001 RepID=UPI001AFEF87C|nr:DUF3800 domain-containing protein [Cellulomonas sp.]MBO9556197.1 DUF3800 domain-containing protein [Cellulomonas sp.]